MESSTFGEIPRGAMSKENVKTLRKAAAAFNRGDLDALIEYWTDDIDYRAVEGAPDDHGPIDGRIGGPPPP